MLHNQCDTRYRDMRYLKNTKHVLTEKNNFDMKWKYIYDFKLLLSSLLGPVMFYFFLQWEKYVLTPS